MNTSVKWNRPNRFLQQPSICLVALAALAVASFAACGDQTDTARSGGADTLDGSVLTPSAARLDASTLRRVCNLERPYVAERDGYLSLKNDDLVYFDNIPGNPTTYRVHRLDHAGEGKFPATLNNKVTLCDFSWHRRMIKNEFKAILMPVLPHTGNGVTVGPEDFVDVASLSADRLEPVRNEHLSLIRSTGGASKRGWLADAGVVLTEASLGRVVRGLPTQSYSGITLTSYYPSSDPLQGGFNDRFGVPLAGRTINDFLSKVRSEGFANQPYVVVAMDYKIGRDNEYLRIPEMEELFGAGCIAFKVRDTGGAFIGRGLGQPKAFCGWFSGRFAV